MNENKKMLIMGIVIIIVLALIPITALITNIRSKNILNGVSEYIQDEDYKVVYIGRDNCYYCTLFSPEIELLEGEVGLNYLYVNTNKLKSNHLSALLENLEIDASDFGTPYLVITKDGEIVDQKSGYMPENHLFDYLKEQGVIGQDETLALNYIDYEEYSNLISSQEKELIVIAQSGCDGCLQARPILYEIADEYGIEINYLNASMLDQDEVTSFQTSLTYFEENGISTPTMLVVSNNEVVDTLVGNVDKDVYLEFLEENGFIEK